MHAATDHSRPQCGFTLIELLVVVAMVAILIAVAVPSFTGMIQVQRVQSAGESLIATASTARSEAMTRKRAVTFCVSAGDGRCIASTNWSSATQPHALAFVDADGDLIANNADVIIREQAIGGNGVTLTSTAATLQFLPTGRASAASVVEVVGSGCAAGVDSGRRQQVQITLTGRASVRRLPCA